MRGFFCPVFRSCIFTHGLTVGVARYSFAVYASSDIWALSPAWLAVLDAHPQLWNAFSVLDGLVRAAAALPIGGHGSIVDDLLDRGAAEYPKLPAWLLKPNAKAPRLSPLGIRVGGDDEAWIYRREHLDLWQRLGALDWARAIAPTRRR